MLRVLDPTIIRAASLHVQNMEKDAGLREDIGPMAADAARRAAAATAEATRKTFRPAITGYGRATQRGASVPSAVWRGARGQAAHWSRGQSEPYADRTEELAREAVRKAGGAAKLTGLVLGGATVAAALPQMAASARQARDEIQQAYDENFQQYPGGR